MASYLPLLGRISSAPYPKGKTKPKWPSINYTVLNYLKSSKKRHLSISRSFLRVVLLYPCDCSDCCWSTYFLSIGPYVRHIYRYEKPLKEIQCRRRRRFLVPSGCLPIDSGNDDQDRSSHTMRRPTSCVPTSDTYLCLFGLGYAPPQPFASPCTKGISSQTNQGLLWINFYYCWW